MAEDNAFAAAPQPDAAWNSQQPPNEASRKAAPLREAELMQKLVWSVPETAFMCGVGARTVWRLMATPDAGFPKPRRVGGRTLFLRSEILAFLAKGATR